MDLSRTFWVSTTTFVTSFILAALVWLLLRPPEATAGPAVVDDIDLTGQMRGVVQETVHAVSTLSSMTPATTTQEIVQHRERVAALVEGCERLAKSLEEAETSWIPLSEAQLLLKHAAEFGTDALSRIPTQQVTARVSAGASPTETRPDMTGITPEAVSILQSRANQLLKESAVLQQNVRQAALTAAFTRGIWLGFQARDYLLALMLIVCVTGSISLWQCRNRLKVSPFGMLHSDLKLQSEQHPNEAVDECYRLSKELLKLADQILVSVHPSE